MSDHPDAAGATDSSASPATAFLADAFTADPAIDDTVDPAFIEDTDAEYGQPVLDDTAGEIEHRDPYASSDPGPMYDDLSVDPETDSFESSAPAWPDAEAVSEGEPAPPAAPDDVELRERQAEALEELGRGAPLGGIGASIYDRDDDDDSEYGVAQEPASIASASDAADSIKSTPKRQNPLQHLSPRGRLGAIIVIAVVILIVVGALAGSCGSSGDEPAAQTTGAGYKPATTQAAPPSQPGGVAAGDAPIPIKSAEAEGCQPGSTRAMNAFDTQGNDAWVCVLKTRNVPGQFVRVKFDGAYIVTGVSIVPGFERKNADGSDEWIKHQTAAKVSYEFNDPKAIRYTQPTLSLRSGAQTPINPPLLASAMVVTVLQFGTPGGNSGGAGAPIETTTPDLGAGPTPDASRPPADFAITSIVVYGRKPK